MFLFVPTFALAVLGLVVFSRRGRHGRLAKTDAGEVGDLASRHIAILDLDDLAGVNAVAGLDTGDHLLHAVGDVLRRALPKGARLDRLEGGRFVVWHPPSPLQSALSRTDRMRALAAQTIVGGPSGPISRRVSAGLVSVHPGESRGHSILRAGAAVAQAKTMGGDRTEALTGAPAPSLAPARAQIEAAIASRALEYHVQPICALDGRRAVGVETLIRWNRPDGTVAGPAGFLETLTRIPDAGVDIFPALAMAAATPFVHAPAPLYVTFNITGAVLDGRDGPGQRWMREILDRLPPERLVLEIVETAVIVDAERAAALIERIRARGVRIALDDFGTGLSNLERLRRFPVDLLKLDRAFVGGLGGAGREEAILEAAVLLAERLDIDLVAEGIETETQAATLRDLGVRYGQGYLLGRPAPVSEWAARLMP